MTEKVSRGKQLIVIDPGHGGKDPGATGVKGTLEKDLNLEVSKRVKRILEEKYRVRSTRDGL